MVSWLVGQETGKNKRLDSTQAQNDKKGDKRKNFCKKVNRQAQFGRFN